MRCQNIAFLVFWVCPGRLVEWNGSGSSISIRILSIFVNFQATQVAICWWALHWEPPIVEVTKNYIRHRRVYYQKRPCSPPNPIVHHQIQTTLMGPKKFGSDYKKKASVEYDKLWKKLWRTSQLRDGLCACRITIGCSGLYRSTGSMGTHFYC